MRFHISGLGAEVSDGMDPAIKLFGKMIPLPESGKISDPPPDPPTEPSGDEKAEYRETTCAEDKDPMLDVLEESDRSKPASSSDLNDGKEDDLQTSTQDVKAIADRAKVDTSAEEKVLKKPDKVLRCPRCNSLDTKFCYYNNYNVNQPRHFCKNCQRYWTAGGAMRNVPVGAGRRKGKQSASQYRQIMMPSDGPDSAHHQALSGELPTPTRPSNGNGAALKIGPEAPLCESLAYVLNLGDQKRNADTGSVALGESRDEPMCASSETASNDCAETSVHKEQYNVPGCSNGVDLMHHLQCYPGPPFVFPWSPEWNGVSATMASWRSSEQFYRSENGGQNPTPWIPPSMPAPVFCPPTIAFPFVPAAFWGCMSNSPNWAWNVPWVGSNGLLSPSSSTSNSGCSANGSPTLGKHSRDTGSEGDEKMEKSLWIPKILRIDDPDEAAKSSIWATLGIKPDESIKKGGIFKAFRSKNVSKDHLTDATQVVYANPAALCRSQTFQEST